MHESTDKVRIDVKVNGKSYALEVEPRLLLVEDDPRAYKKAHTSGRIGWVQVRLRKAHDFVRDAIGEDAEPRLKELLEVG